MTCSLLRLYVSSCGHHVHWRSVRPWFRIFLQSKLGVCAFAEFHHPPDRFGLANVQVLVFRSTPDHLADSHIRSNRPNIRIGVDVLLNPTNLNPHVSKLVLLGHCDWKFFGSSKKAFLGGNPYGDPDPSNSGCKDAQYLPSSWACHACDFGQFILGGLYTVPTFCWQVHSGSERGSWRVFSKWPLFCLNFNFPCVARADSRRR